MDLFVSSLESPGCNFIKMIGLLRPRKPAQNPASLFPCCPCETMSRVGLANAITLVREQHGAYEEAVRVGGGGVGTRTLNAELLVPYVTQVLLLALQRFSPPARQKPGKKLSLTVAGVEDAAVIYAQAVFARAFPFLPDPSSLVLFTVRREGPAAARVWQLPGS